MDIETIVENSVLRFKQALGWKADWIDAEDIEKYKGEIRRVVQEARRA
jgi:tetrahydromethanopterin S-methyltransferase subunit A